MDVNTGLSAWKIGLLVSQWLHTFQHLDIRQDEATGSRTYLVVTDPLSEIQRLEVPTVTSINQSFRKGFWGRVGVR